MLYRLIAQIIVGILGLWIAKEFISGVDFTGPILPDIKAGWKHFTTTLVFAGIILGALNSLVKPILNIISWPLRVLTLNLFSLVIAIGLIWIVSYYIPELIVKGIFPLFWITLIIWGLSFFFSPIKQKKPLPKNI